MVSEMRDAYTTRENTSRPSLSVPNRNATPSRTPKKCRSEGNRFHSLYSTPRTKKWIGWRTVTSSWYFQRSVTGSRSGFRP